jgi:hypothetical protein
MSNVRPLITNVRGSGKIHTLNLLEHRISFNSRVGQMIGFSHISRLCRLNRTLLRSHAIQVSKKSHGYLLLLLPHSMIILYTKHAFYNSNEIYFRLF